MFRSKNKTRMRPFKPVKEVLVPTTKVVSEEHDGVLTDVVVNDYRNILDPLQEVDIPGPDEYSLENLLKSGVPLKEIPCGTLLNESDLADVSSFATSKLIGAINEMEVASSSVVEAVEEIPSNTPPPVE